uniref:C2H2-type domain-containing protein n=1 Tax=Glossina brevipalpis TaxID=37001 RepID=A0A1A9WT64_9MUSC
MVSRDPYCHICHQSDYRYLHSDEVCEAKAPKSQKSLLEIIKHIVKVLKVDFEVPLKARVCNACYKELVQYDNYVVELLAVQKRLTKKIELRMKEGEKYSTDQCEVLENLESNNCKGSECNDKIDHIRSQHDDELTEESEDDDLTHDDCQNEEHGPLKCVICSKMFKNNQALKIHNDMEHKQRITCSVCGVAVRNEDYLVLHMNLHNGKTENECSFCSRKYARKVNVMRHMQKHFGKDNHQCERCGMVFSETSAFYNHRLKHEAEEEPLICNVCNQSFKTIRTYKVHINTHREDRPRYNCEHCPKVFVDKYTLKVHLRQHNESVNIRLRTSSKRIKGNGQTTFTCLICQDIFQTKDLYDDHMQSTHDVILENKFGSSAGIFTQKQKRDEHIIEILGINKAK